MKDARAMKNLADSRILIVDDVKDNVDVLINALRNDYKLSVALDGATALRSVEKSPPDLVLLDIMMPDLDGYEVCRQLRAREATREVPVMFLSALEDARDKARGFEVGGNDYLTKPFEELEIKARVRSLLRAKAYADAVREAMARDLRIAREIQMGILPADIAAATRGTGLDVHAVVEPAREVGGDLYEVLRASDHRVVVALGDVSGKGIPAALFMAVVVSVLRTLARQIAEPDEILRRLNDELAEQNPRGMFVTLQCLVFDLEQRRVSCAGAGHHQLALLSPGCPPRLACASSGRPAGLMPFNPIERETLPLAAGDTFVLFSDGVSEAMNADEDFYGEERLLATLAAASDTTPRQAVTRVLDDVRAFADGAKQSDDITVVAVQYAPVNQDGSSALRQP
ncbi:MAG TPA: fused response regulator/phosphatase [Vicinamibacterales bacterium]|nr:fused response regulator/phosphatase [Vicinamibacterales bacterium]